MMDPLDLLTEDCWKEILKRVKAPKDLWSCSKACLIFQEILWMKRNQFMFHLILPHILEYIPAPHHPQNNELQQWKPLLKSRLVCKCWRTSIDKLQDAECRYLFENAYRFTSGEGIEEFLRRFAKHPGNPFIGRVLSFQIRPTPLLLLAGHQNQDLNVDRDPAEENMAFCIRKLRQLLERFGNEIWKVRMQNYGDNLPFCKNIQTDLSHLPNLHSLHLRGPHRTYFELDIGSIVELTTYIAANPLPDLPRLRSLTALGVSRAMMQLILEKYAPQLTYFIAYDLSGFPFPEHSLRLSNLVKLHLDGLDASTSLEALRQLNSPLRSLGLEVARNRNRLGVWSIDDLFRNIGHLPIHHLTIWIRHVFLGESGAISAEQRPHHGSISSLNLKFSSGVSFNLLLYCSVLTSVHVVNKYRRPRALPRHPDGVPELLDVGELLRQEGHDLYQSNIWDNLRHLQDFKLEERTGNANHRRCQYYKRGEYEKRKLEQRGGAAGDGFQLGQGLHLNT